MAEAMIEKNMIARHLEESIAVKTAMLAMTEPVERAAECLVDCLRSGHRVVIFGNGGSAADAQHFAAELVGRLETDHGCLPAVALTTDSSILTALGNDFGFDQVFARQVRAHVRDGDVAIGISTSGNSANVVEGIRQARQLGARTIGMVGQEGGRLADFCDHLLRVPSSRTMRIQECHLTLVHILCYAVESAFVEDERLGQPH